MANEHMYPCLPCADLDASIAFYEALGFTRTYQQSRPNPYAVVALEDMHMHLFGIEEFQAADSYGSVIIVVPDPQSLSAAFAARLRKQFGKLPTVGIPRLLRPRKKFGTMQGFSVIDPGGNWLRIYKLNDAVPAEQAEGLNGILNVAARLGDAKGDAALALTTLEEEQWRCQRLSPCDYVVSASCYRAQHSVVYTACVPRLRGPGGPNSHSVVASRSQ